MQEKENMKKTVGSASQSVKTKKTVLKQNSPLNKRNKKMHNPPERAVYPEYVKPKKEKKSETIMVHKGEEEVKQDKKILKTQNVIKAADHSKDQKKESDFFITPIWDESRASKLAEEQNLAGNKVSETKKVNVSHGRKGQKKSAIEKTGSYGVEEKHGCHQTNKNRTGLHHQKRQQVAEKPFSKKSDSLSSKNPHQVQTNLKGKKQNNGLPLLSRRLLMLILIIVFIVISIVVISVIYNNKEKSQSATFTSKESSITSPVSDSSVYPKGTDPLTLGSITQLVNQSHGLPQDYEPTDLVLNDLPSLRNTYMRSEAATALSQLFVAAQNEGANLICCSGYRSYQDQVEVYANEVENIGEYTTKMTTAPPGYSEHQSGLCIDVTSDSVGRVLVTDFINTTEGQWIAKHAWEYGFIVRYLNGKESITGYTYEPWHIRYLGKEVAKSVYESGNTYEEYLGILD